MKDGREKKAAVFSHTVGKEADEKERKKKSKVCLACVYLCAPNDGRLFSCPPEAGLVTDTDLHKRLAGDGDGERKEE